MRQNRYLNFLLWQIVSIPLVIVIFHFMSDHKVASVITGAVFVLTCLVQFWREYSQNRLQAKLFWLGGLQFFIFFAIPIFVSRLTNWDLDFQQIQVGPVSAATLHYYSNFSYFFWMGTCVFEGARLMKRKKAL